MRLSEGEVAAPKNKKSFTNHDANPNLFRKSKQHAFRDRAAVWNRKKNAARCSSNNVRLLTNRCNCAEWGRRVLYWFPLGVQSVVQGKVHGGKRGAVQGLTFQHPCLAISDLIFQLCSIYTRRCWCQSATPWRWDSGKTSCVSFFPGDGVLDQGGGGVRGVGGAAVQEGRWEPVRRGAWTKVHRCHWHCVQYCTGKKIILFPKLFLVQDSSIGDLISHSLTD